MRLLGDWGPVLSMETHGEAVREAVKASRGCCAYCGFRAPITSTHPTAGLVGALRFAGLAPEPDNLVTLCAFCEKLNSLESLKGCGSFVEVPWLSQSQLTNLLRVTYCVQASTERYIQQTNLYQGSNAIVKALARTPKGWKERNFDGSVERIIDAVRDHRGFIDASEGQTVYIDRLRFCFAPEPFEAAIEHWAPTVEAQLIQEEG